MNKDKDMKNIDATSKDLIEHNLEQLKQIFPSAFTEGKINFDALKSELGEHIEKNDERYQFTWAGKEQAKRIATTPSLGTLRPAPEESLNWDNTENLYIEGDNLEVLKLLQKSYFGKVKMIYIDPPYNTGKDFVYKDDFKDNLANYKRLTNQVDNEGNPLRTNSDSAGRYHSNWLNMMYPRLKLARNLLKDDGVILLSIDDNEVHNLKKICDEVFGEDNFISNIIWQKKYGAANDAKYLSDLHDHILLYAKDKSNWRPNLFPRPDELNAKYTNPDNDPRGDWYSTNLSVKTYSEKNDYIITSPAGHQFSPPPSRCWVVSKEKYKELLQDNRIWFGKDGNSRPYLKSFLSEVQDGVVPTTIWSHHDAGHNIGAKTEIRKLFHDTTGLFDTPKPTKLIKRMLDMVCNKKEKIDLVLDFFSGSATTAHSVMQLNSEDNGNRKYIMVQIPEPTPTNSEARKAGYETISEIGKERIRRAAAKIKEEHPDTTTDLGFKVLKLDTSNIKKWQPDLENLEQDIFDAAENIMPNRSNEDLLYEVLLKYGLPLTLPVETLDLDGYIIFNVAAGSLIACFDENVNLDTIQSIINLGTDDTPILRVVFLDNGFADSTIKTNAIQRLKQAGIEDVLSI